MDKYRLLRAESAWDLQFEVNELLSEGWELHGNLTVDDGVYLQAMVLREEGVLNE